MHATQRLGFYLLAALTVFAFAVPCKATRDAHQRALRTRVCCQRKNSS
jgi:hypothetical protein